MELFNYESCIKVKGIKFLPPLITSARRIEINEDKRKAIEIEKRLKYERDLKAFIDSLEPSLNRSVDAITTRKSCTSLEHKVAFNDEKVQTERDAVGVHCDKKNLVSFVFDVTEYNKDGIVLLSDDASSSATTTEALVTHCDKIVACPEKPKLIRSNSYTLLSPSPALLEYLKNQEKEKSIQLMPTESELDCSSALYDSAYETLEGKDSSVPSGNKKLQESSILDENFLSFNNETIDNLIKMHFVETEESSHEINLMDSHLEEMEAALADILESQSSDLRDYDSSLQNENRQRYEVTSRSEINSTIFNTSTPLLIDFESDGCENETVSNFQRNATHNEIDSDPLNVLMSLDDYKRLSSDDRTVNCSRQLFSDNSERRVPRERWAATVLTAAARGYLVRRLKRTEHVRGLIQTIHDTITCAFQLHKDDVDSIPIADIELHRRLIVQLTSACHEFYDTFFTLTVSERMALIAQDRQRKIDKLKKASLKMELRQSRPKSRRQSINKISKSFTPSFAA